MPPPLLMFVLQSEDSGRPGSLYRGLARCSPGLRDSTLNALFPGWDDGGGDDDNGDSDGGYPFLHTYYAPGAVLDT